MRLRKCVFVEGGSPSIMFKKGDNTGLGPSTSSQLPSVPASQCWSGIAERGPPVSTWIWVLPPASHEIASASPARAARAIATWLPWQRPHGDRDRDNGCSGAHDGQKGAEAGWRQPWRLCAQSQRQSNQHPSPHPTRNRSDGGAGSGTGGCGCSRPLLLASLSTSILAASRAGGSSSDGATGASNTAAVAPGPGAGVGPRGPRSGFHLPQLSIMRLPGSPAFAEDQDLAQELLDYHTAKHGGFPRPCPRCKSNDFMVRRTEEATAPATNGKGKEPSNASADGAGAGANDGDAGVVEWRSRPLCCETCGRWVHVGCAGVQYAEQVPPRPWFHCRACRNTYLRLEAAAERNPHPSCASPTHALYLLTPADHHAALALPGASAAAGSGPAAVTASGAGRLAVGSLHARGPAGAVVPLLAQGFNADAIQGFGQPAREYDGGKYSAVLLSRGQPVAAATFNVFGDEAQLCLLATALQHRLKGNGSALVADLEAVLADLGVSRMLVQSRSVALPLWLGRLGYSIVEPAEVEQLHRRLPIAYYDCALLQKHLTPRSQQPQLQQPAVQSRM
ncbi:hypothetical protein Vretifemale_11630 [Volvox reticuliferus]|uniref:N-acetyltransferase domain-containing protein n=1 Tax=Volvox reticuliferus TaxID=1737510 RepID=A0A8J4CQB2_9CHLO|nr:hypothetical protein Vretifemale_11630 [Volvox reticuliferus]